MTVCIAAICTYQKAWMIVAAADRMITSGDIEFEQPQPKVFQLGEHSVSLIFGDMAAQHSVAAAVQRRIVTDRITNTENLADAYADEYAKQRLKIAESVILRPLGLDRESFVVRQQSLDRNLVATVKEELQAYHLDRGGGAIIAGADTLGAHIYTVSDPGVATYMDSIGFVAGGAGQWHAESQFMFSRYVKNWDLERALYLVYAAKRRAEVAPGVGLATDIVMITTTPRQIYHFTDGTSLVDGLKRIYDEELERDKTARGATDERVRQFVQDLLKPPSPPPPATPGT